MLTLSCSAGYIDHNFSNAWALDFRLLPGLGCLYSFGVEGDMLKKFRPSKIEILEEGKEEPVYRKARDKYQVR